LYLKDTQFLILQADEGHINPFFTDLSANCALGIACKVSFVKLMDNQ